MRLMGHVTSHFNNNIPPSMTTVYLDIEKAFGNTRQLGLLYKLSNLAPFFQPKQSDIRLKAKRLRLRSTTRFRPVPHPVQFVYH